MNEEKIDRVKRSQQKSPPLFFTKMTGTGNDFLIFDARATSYSKKDRPLLAKSLCRRTLSIGADGVVFIEKSDDTSCAFKWDFYNADGSVAEMCGNAARCVARYAFEKKWADQSLRFETLAGVIVARIINGGTVEVDFASPKVLAAQLEVPVGEHIKIQVMYLVAGVPHVVKLNDDWDPSYLDEMGAYLRNHALFAATNGANATFYEVVGDSAITAVTFERGVEAVTLACGSGAVAAATAAAIRGMKSPIEVQMPGGKLLVRVGQKGSPTSLVGEARFICEGEVRSEAFL